MGPQCYHQSFHGRREWAASSPDPESFGECPKEAAKMVTVPSSNSPLRVLLELSHALRRHTRLMSLLMTAAEVGTHLRTSCLADLFGHFDPTPWWHFDFAGRTLVSRVELSHSRCFLQCALCESYLLFLCDHLLLQKHTTRRLNILQGCYLENRTQPQCAQ